MGVINLKMIAQDDSHEESVNIVSMSEFTSEPYISAFDFATNGRTNVSKLSGTPVNWFNAFLRCYGHTLGNDYSDLVGKGVYFKEGDRTLGFQMILLSDGNTPYFAMGNPNKLSIYGFAAYDANYASNPRDMVMIMPPIFAGCNSMSQVMDVLNATSNQTISSSGRFNATSQLNFPFSIYYKNGDNFERESGNYDNYLNLTTAMSVIRTFYGENIGSIKDISLDLLTPIRGIPEVDFTLPIQSTAQFSKLGRSVYSPEGWRDLEIVNFFGSPGTDLSYFFGDDFDGSRKYTVNFKNFSLTCELKDVQMPDGSTKRKYVIDISLGSVHYVTYTDEIRNWATIKKDKQIRYGGYQWGIFLATTPEFTVLEPSSWASSVQDPDPTFQYQYPRAPFSVSQTRLTADFSHQVFQEIPDKDITNVGSYFVTNIAINQNYLGAVYASQATGEEAPTAGWWKTLLSGNFDKPDIIIPGGSANSNGAQGGQGSFSGENDATADNSSMPDSAYKNTDGNISKITETFRSNVGKMGQYFKITLPEFQKLGKALWTDTFGEWLTQKFYGMKPADFVMSVKVLPFVPRSSSQAKKVQSIAGYSIPIEDQPVLYECYDYSSFNLGKVSFKTRYFDSFLDYLSTYVLYLPFIGEITLSPDIIVGYDLNLKCTIDNRNGDIIYNLVNDKNELVGEWSGQCGYDYKFASGDIYSASIKAIGTSIKAGAYVGSLAATAGKLSGISKKVMSSLNDEIGISEDIGNATDAEPSFGTSSSVSGDISIVSTMKPYFKIDRPIVSQPDGFQKLKGFMSNVTAKLSEVSGYTEVNTVHLENMGNATETEIAEIESLLKSGVVF